MSDDRPAGNVALTASDVGAYCRSVEDHLTRVNAGHLVRIVGPGFELVRQWAEAGVPLSVVYRGIELKAERFREGASRRPLHIEFCASDVQALFDHWRRAVGLVNANDPAAESRRPSLGRHLDHAIDRLSRAIGRVDAPDVLRQEGTRILEALAALKESSYRARGPAREEAEGALIALDLELSQIARQAAPPEWLASLREEAAADLQPFRSRLDGAAWERSVVLTIDRLLRERLGLPTLGL